MSDDPWLCIDDSDSPELEKFIAELVSEAVAQVDGNIGTNHPRRAEILAWTASLVGGLCRTNIANARAAAAIERARANAADDSPPNLH
jgi:hypothetical protein